MHDTPLPTAPAARPALYSIRDSDTTIYVFGTFHVLDSDIRWFGGPVEQAFGEAGELVVETLPPDGAVARTPVVPAPVASVIPSASFLSTTQLAVKAGQEQGMRLDDGADMVLLRTAAAEGKAVEQLETIQSQLAMFSRIPTEAPARAQPPSPSAAPRAPSGLPETLAVLQQAWTIGEYGIFAAMLGQMRHSSPEAYRIMFTERNERWAYWVAARMRSPGTVFVAVGAGHLVGPDSLLVRLAQRGFNSRRVR
ncbi:MAG: TraB/GumN family protein [Sphingomicrobium sp.]